MTLCLSTLNSYSGFDTQSVHSETPPPKLQVPNEAEENFALHFAVIQTRLPSLEMLVKVEYRGVQKYMKVPESDECFHYTKFLQDVTAKFCCEPQLFTEGVLVLTDTSDTEVDSDIFDELVRSGVRAFRVGYQKQLATDLTLILKSTKSRKKGQEELDRDQAKQMVYTVLRSNPKGEEIFNEHDKTKTLSDATRRQMVNILVADMIESHGRIPPIGVRTNYALGIATLFPYLQDPYSKNGYVFILSETPHIILPCFYSFDK
ncbi:uncharacterized protein ACNS7B_000376 [Menidia menidia]